MLKESMSRSSIVPFCGLIYNRLIFSDISKLVCPPYDVIEDPKKYYERSPYNAIRLELPIGEDRYEKAKETLEEWLREGVLVKEEKESIYVLEQEFSFEGRRFERIGFLSLVLLNEAKILTHERTKKEPKEDRKRLYCKTRTFSSFVFGLYEDESDEIASVLRSPIREKIFEFDEDFDIRTKVYRISEESTIGILSELFGGRKIYLADGHHRLSVAYELNLGKIPIYLTNLYGDGLKIAPYHRLIRLTKEKEVTPNIFFSGGAQKEIEFERERVMRELEEGRFGLLTRKEPELVYIFEFGSKDGSYSSKFRYIHEEILKRKMGIEEDSISYTPYLKKAYESLKNREYDFALLFPPVKVDEVKKVADSGSVLPPKSTYFFPKVPSGPIFFKYG